MQQLLEARNRAILAGEQSATLGGSGLETGNEMRRAFALGRTDQLGAS